eukprot:CAMPEP_0184735088 /NCGR_PEP_ID=MMETSP0314-20130426/61707_1 /TAXON_ID=38298 /ORGANISM="Rhodella maculata, Strain CCMP 736" /LENGTH=237 /DNA_ID=CAMNT_0027202113 /DNA_START=729 /DNA_END=1443 /DNA_ORIENTATION=+
MSPPAADPAERSPPGCGRPSTAALAGALLSPAFFPWCPRDIPNSGSAEASSPNLGEEEASSPNLGEEARPLRLSAPASLGEEAYCGPRGHSRRLSRRSMLSGDLRLVLSLVICPLLAHASEPLPPRRVVSAAGTARTTQSSHRHRRDARFGILAASRAAVALAALTAGMPVSFDRCSRRCSSRSRLFSVVPAGYPVDWFRSKLLHPKTPARIAEEARLEQLAQATVRLLRAEHHPEG